MQSSNNVAGVIVYYKPTLENIHSTFLNVKKLDFIVVVVNGIKEGIYDELECSDKIHMIYLGVNKGLATAANIGLKYLQDKKHVKFVSLLDQDSILPENYCALLEHRRMLIANGSKVGVIAPVYYNSRSKLISKILIFSKFWFKRFIPIDEVNECTSPIASGSLVSMDLFADVGFLLDDLFIDYVDNEFCFRLYCLGYRNYVISSVRMSHELGNQSLFYFFGFVIKPTNHSPIRKYYITRNRLYVLVRYSKIFPSLIFFEFLAFSVDLLRIIFFERNKLEKSKMIALGFFDFLLGNMGAKP